MAYDALDDIDGMQQLTNLIAGDGVLFEQLTPEQKIKIVNLHIMNCINKNVYDIGVNLESQDQWFRHSKVFDGLN